jgi:hypothetical protein
MAADGNRGAPRDRGAAQPDRRSGEHRTPSSAIETRPAAASPAHAAAIAAAIEQFVRDTAPESVPAEPTVRPWLRAGLYEHAGLDPAGPSPWGDGEPWGR